MKKHYLIPMFFIFCTTLLAQKVVNPQDKKAVLDLMEAQENAWNEGDLDRFMLGYWQNEALVFVGRTGPTYGYANTLAKYIQTKKQWVLCLLAYFISNNGTLVSYSSLENSP